MTFSESRRLNRPIIISRADKTTLSDETLEKLR